MEQNSSERRVVIVTGSARGIGRDILESFRRDGSIVIALDLPSDSLDALGRELEAADEGTTIPVDVRDGELTRAAANSIADRFGRIDVLVNNAGVNAVGWVDELSDEAWDTCFDVNVGGVFRMSRAVIPAMKRQNSGRIINAASFAAIVPSVGQAAYAASKAAVVHFTRTLAGELGPWNITANSYAPGMVPTAMNGFAELPDAEQSVLLDTLTLRRWSDSSDVADVVLFLASDAARYVTGTVIDVSGGKLATQIPARAHARAAEFGG